MKKYIYHLLWSLAAAPVLFGCSIDKTEFVVFDDADLFRPTACVYDDLGESIPVTPLTDALGEDTKGSSITVNTLAKGVLSLHSGSRVESLIGTYPSVDKDGNRLQLSGRVMLPASGKIKNIIVVSHFTITTDYECPSKSFQLEGLLVLDGYAMIFPDYIGYGVTSDMLHPYLCAELTARNVVDMVDAVVPYLEKIGRAPEDDALILMGYSQGGATTMAVQKLLENDSEYYGKYRIKRNYAGAGPYDIALTYDTCIEQDKTSIPCAIPMIIMGMNAGENLDLDYSVFFRQKLLDNYQEWILSKKYTTKQLGVLMGTNRLSDLMTESARDKRNPKTTDFYIAMMHNSVLEGWYPSAPVYMFHSMDDDTVPYVNTEEAMEAFEISNIEYNIGHYGNHVTGCMRFILAVHEMLK